jgi:outer membrane immunogenic protein
MMIRVSILLLVAIVTATPAGASEEAAQGAQGGTAGASTFRWSGVYVGGNAGFGWNNYDSTTTNTANGVTTPTSATNNGALGGGQVGFNYLVAPLWLVGVEADVDGATISKDTQTENAAGVTTATSTSSTKAIGTVRGGVGYAWNAMLLSVNGGLAWHRVNATRTQVTGHLNNATAGTVEDNSYSSPGWTLGGEAAAGLHDQWVVKGEYLFLHFSHTTTTPMSLLSTTTTGHLQMIRVGMSYLFN